MRGATPGRAVRAVRRLRCGVAAVLLSAPLAAAQAASPGPLPGPLHIVGGGAIGGCLAGAVTLPEHSLGIETIHRNRSHFWGAPQTIAELELLGREAKAQGLPTLLVEDISGPRGGPMDEGGHVAHQTGLDADVALDMRPRPPLTAVQREGIVLASLVRPDRRDVVPGIWSPAVIEVLHLAATLPDVDRVLVNPAIKQALCRYVHGDRSWLHRIRPWWGHAAHMHMHFRCPAGQADCREIPPPPPGDGCDATLQWWFDQLSLPPKPPQPHHPAPLPAACKAILTGRGG